MKTPILFISISMFLLLLNACNSENYYHEEINGNQLTITEKHKGKIGTHTYKYQKIKVLNIRIDDDSEYHITYEMGGNIYSEKDLDGSIFGIYLRNGIGDSWYSRNERPRFRVTYPSSKIQYFED